jgi:hypothetical protein
MKQQAFLQRISWTSPAFLLLVLGVAVMAIQLTLILKIGSPDRQITSILFGLTTAHLIWERKDKLNLQTSLGASVLGGVIIALLLLKTTGYC